MSPGPFLGQLDPWEVQASSIRDRLCQPPQSSHGPSTPVRAHTSICNGNGSRQRRVEREKKICEDFSIVGREFTHTYTHTRSPTIPNLCVELCCERAVRENLHLESAFLPYLTTAPALFSPAIEYFGYRFPKSAPAVVPFCLCRFKIAVKLDCN